MPGIGIDGAQETRFSSKWFLQMLEGEEGDRLERKKIASWRGRLRRLRHARHYYAKTSDWLFSFYHRLLLYFPRLRLPWRNTTRLVHLRGVSEPLHVRLGTTDWYVMEEVFLDRVYEALVHRRLTNVRNVLDLGANTGFTVRLWQTLYPKARIVAVEPDEANLAMCKVNTLKKVGGKQLKFVQACVAGRARSVFLDRTNGAWRFTLSETNNQMTKPLLAITLPDILKMCAVDEPIDLLKCDIEGSEAEVFSDCSAWIGRVRNLVVELHHPYTSERFCEDLRRAGGGLKIYHKVSSDGNNELVFLEQLAAV